MKRPCEWLLATPYVLYIRFWTVLTGHVIPLGNRIDTLFRLPMSISLLLHPTLWKAKYFDNCWQDCFLCGLNYFNNCSKFSSISVSWILLLISYWKKLDSCTVTYIPTKYEFDLMEDFLSSFTLKSPQRYFCSLGNDVKPIALGPDIYL